MMHETKRGEHYPVVHPKVSDGLVHALAQDTERKRDWKIYRVILSGLLHFDTVSKHKWTTTHDSLLSVHNP